MRFSTPNIAYVPSSLEEGIRCKGGGQPDQGRAGAAACLHLGVGQRLHPQVIHALALHEILHVQLVGTFALQVGDPEVEPLRVPVRVDVER